MENTDLVFCDNKIHNYKSDEGRIFVLTYTREKMESDRRDEAAKRKLDLIYKMLATRAENFHEIREIFEHLDFIADTRPNPLTHEERLQILLRDFRNTLVRYRIIDEFGSILI